ncbi:Nucleoside-triphosphatase THEP1 [Gossypium australe]|uniref:Nucleoside-triphosphatase THEP1 n=1 Tax=Gossypium australe TaxID=47621 RepID=A0A5B6WGX4_9ROSI|nr:Nucleoside-triphosphatase THEP1 [Gossypium australe]
MTVVVTPLSGSEKLCFREVFTSAWASGLLPGYICTYVFVKFSLPHGHREMYSPEPNSVSIHGQFLKLESWLWRTNSLIKWKTMQSSVHEKGDSLAEGYVSELRDFARISVTQNELQELKGIWTQWDDEAKQLFYCNYGDLPYLLDVKIDLVPTVEEYTTLFR